MFVRNRILTRTRFIDLGGVRRWLRAASAVCWHGAHQDDPREVWATLVALAKDLPRVMREADE